MKNSPKQKMFDCVRMKRELQARVQAATKDLSAEQELAYFRRFADSDSPLARKFREFRQPHPSPTASADHGTA